MLFLYEAIDRIPSYLKTALSGWLARGIFIACKLLTIPLLLQHLPKEQYAALAILGSLEGWFLLLDFGIGMSIQTHLSESKADSRLLAGMVKIAAILALVFFLFGLLTIICALPFLSSFFLGSILLESQSASFFLFCSICLLLMTQGSIASKILLAKHQGHFMYFVQSLGSLCSLASLIFLACQDHLSLFSSALAVFGVPSFFSFCLAIFVFSKTKWKEKINKQILKKVLLRAKSFFLFTFLASLVTLSDAIIAPKILGIEAIIEYNFLCKVFGVASFAYSAFLQGLCPEFSEALSLGRFKEVIRRLRFFCFLGVVGVIGFSFSVYVFSGFIKNVFSISLEAFPIVLFGLYLCIRVVSDFHAMALQSHSKLRSFFVLVPIQAMLSLILQCVLGLYLGVVGILLGLSVSYLLTVFWALPWELQKRAKQVNAF